MACWEVHFTCKLNRVQSKELPLSFCRITDTPWPSLASILSKKPNVSYATVSSVYCDEPIFRLRRLINDAKSHPICGWTTQNNLSKLPDDCVCGQLRPNAASILRIVFKLKTTEPCHMHMSFKISHIFSLHSINIISRTFFNCCRFCYLNWAVRNFDVTCPFPLQRN